MKQVTKLFNGLRKEGYVAVQRAGDCRSCAYASREDLDVFTTDQSYLDKKVWVYFGTIEGTVITKIADKLGIKYEWSGKDSEAITVLEVA